MRGTFALSGVFGACFDPSNSKVARKDAHGIRACRSTSTSLMMAAASVPLAAALCFRARHGYSLPVHLTISMRLNSRSLTTCRAGHSSGPTWAPFSGGHFPHTEAIIGINLQLARGFLTVAASSLNLRLPVPQGGAMLQGCAAFLPGSFQASLCCYNVFKKHTAACRELSHVLI